MRSPLHHSTTFRRAISPQLSTGDTPLVSQIIDRQNYETLEFILTIGAIDDANATFAVLVEDGNNSGLSDAAAVPDLDLLGTEAQAGFQFDDDNEIRKIGYRGPKRYVRLTVTPTGNSANPTGAFIGAVAALGQPRHAPSQDGTGAETAQTP